MAHLVPNLFTSWELSAEELLQGHSLSPLTACVLQNIIAQKATEKINLSFDPNEPQQFLQREAELKGEIGILQYLLAQSEYSINALNEQNQQ